MGIDTRTIINIMSTIIRTELAPEQRLMTEKEAAQHFRVSRQTLCHLRTKKNLPHYKLGSAILYDIDELYRQFRRAADRCGG